MENKIGLIAGNGLFPLIFARAARSNGKKIIAIGIREETHRDLQKEVEEIHWIGIGEMGRLFEILHREGIKQVVMAGQIRPTLFFCKEIRESLDEDFKRMLAETRDKKADSLLGVVAERLAKEGIELIPSITFLTHLMPGKGLLAGRPPSPQQWEDIYFGLEIAKHMARLDIGQTVVVKDKAILAVEAIEGTDEVIKRGGRLGKGEVVVVKVSKPNQDMRFDVPVIGIETINSLSSARARIMAIEAERTLVIDKECVIKLADKKGICLVSV